MLPISETLTSLFFWFDCPAKGDAHPERLCDTGETTLILKASKFSLLFGSRTLGLTSRTSSIIFALLSTQAASEVTARAAGRELDRSSQRVIQLCHTSQGNGFNWAASHGWLAESFAWQAQSQGRNAPEDRRFDVQCMAGSSSAAGTTVLLAALLENPNLGWSMSPPNPRRLTRSDLLILARALRLLALTADFGLDEQIGFAARYAAPEDSSTRRWWPSRYGTELIRHTLGRRILFASLLQKEDLERTIPSEEASLPSMIKVTDLLEFENIAALPQPGTRAYARATGFLERQRKLAKQIYNIRLGNNLWSWNERADAYLRSSTIPYGFLTTAFALVQPVAEDGLVPVEKVPPAFTRLRKLVIANRATLEVILQSPAFQESVRGKSDDILNFVFGEAVSKANLLQLSQAEPENERRLVGTAASLGIRSIYDPQADTSGTFRLQSASATGLIIAGGWTNPETTAWPLAHFQLAAAANAAAAGNETVATMLRFGKPGRTASFPQKVLKSYFYRNEDGSSPASAETNLQRYLDAYYFDSDHFVTAFRSLFAASQIPFATDKTTFNWDLAPRPAAAANLSQTLFLRVTNGFRDQLAERSGERLPYVFAPTAPSAPTAPE